ncbi:pyruvate dehydrogenase complex dihydrolipoamide acetyltransferase [Saccharopolyspora erythraea]|uniref:pyruvate dehydrogenase complex dihydrolipoamide acetyltransferase n=1 Tax=Saccharopolyspora erythraea TaxID=1836 RepID=UPI001BF0C90D|nr:pyruvate dehydrogenase complex dihydrolipoamide acetyltransferase [Saccharopolyspora erythraea]QUH00728.1 pyruvate dehydrogenase complex dihydrolipoamide acetyltransferase [Saccharopolyspora erythraea]
MTDIQMPRLSDTMEEGVIANWRKQVGDKVNRGDVVAEIETDKALMELEAYDDGVLEKVLVGEGETVPIGTPIAVLGDGSGAAAAQASAPAPAAAPAEPAPAEPAESAPAASAAPAQAPAQPAAAPAEPGAKPKASPLAKAVAKDLGVDISTVTGSGPGGRIIRADIEAAASAAPAPAASDAAQAPAAPAAPAVAQAGEDVEEIPLSNIRKVTAKRLTESKQTAPHFYLTSAVDVTDLVAFRADLNERLQAAGGPKVSINDLIVKAVATALKANPTLNVSFGGDKILQHKRINLGVAVAIESGLVVPVIPDADRKSVSEIAAEGREKAGRAREGKLKLDEMTGGTFTISNLGMFGIEHFSAVINPPEAGILAVGATKDEVQVRDGEFVARKIMRMTLSADHRAVDGAVGAVFMQQLTALLEDPIRIIA